MATEEDVELVATAIRDYVVSEIRGRDGRPISVPVSMWRGHARAALRAIEERTSSSRNPAEAGR